MIWFDHQTAPICFVIKLVNNVRLVNVLLECTVCVTGILSTTIMYRLCYGHSFYYLDVLSVYRHSFVSWRLSACRLEPGRFDIRKIHIIIGMVKSSSVCYLQCFTSGLGLEIQPKAHTSMLPFQPCNAWKHLADGFQWITVKDFFLNLCQWNTFLVNPDL